MIDTFVDSYIHLLVIL